MGQEEVVERRRTWGLVQRGIGWGVGGGADVVDCVEVGCVRVRG